MEVVVAAAGSKKGWQAWCDGRLVVAVAITQLLGVALATTGVSSQLLTNHGIYVPTTQAFLNYALLAVVYGTGCLLGPAARAWWRAYGGDAGSGAVDRADVAAAPAASCAALPGRWARLRRAWPSLAALALLDVEANVAVTAAYRHTSLTSVTLLDCFTIPVVMLLSWLVLRARYNRGHGVGAAACIVGLAVLVLGDGQGAAGGGGGGSGPAPLLGDSLVLLGAVLYAVCNVTQELLLADVEPGELLAALGLFGALISGLQAAALEHAALQRMAWGESSVLLPLLGFAAAMFAFYTLVPRVLLLGGATVLNLGLLTSDAWAALARFLWFGGFQGWSAAFFCTSLLLVAGGLLVFSLSGSPKAEHEAPGADAAGGGASSSGGCANAAASGALPGGSGAAAQGHPDPSHVRADGDVEDPHCCTAPLLSPGSRSAQS